MEDFIILLYWGFYGTGQEIQQAFLLLWKFVCFFQ